MPEPVSSHRPTGDEHGLEVSLQHRRLTLRVLLESSGQAIVAVNADGKLVLANNMAYTMFGYERGELIGAPLETLLPEDTRQRHRKFEGDFFAEASHRPMGRSLDVHGRRKDGSVFPIEVTLDHIETSGGTLAVAFVSDISERKQAEVALRQREEQYRSLFENMNEAVVYCEMVFENGTATDFIYRMVNPRFEKMTGRKDVVGKKVSELVPGIRELDPEWLEIHARVVSTGIPEKFESFLNSLGHWYSMSVYSPEKGFFIAVFDNITERKRTEEALRQSEARYRGLFEHMSEGLAYCEMIFENGVGTDFIYRAVNTRFETLTGLRDVTGKRVTEVVPGIRELDPDLLRTYGRVAQTGVPEKFETYLHSMEQWYSVSAYCPERGFFVAMFDNITERRVAEEALRHSEEQYRGLFENMNEAVVCGEMVFEGGKATDFVYRMVNARFEKLTGQKDLIGKSVTEVLPGVRELDPAWLEMHGRVALTGVPEKAEMFLNSTGQWCSASIYSHKKGFFVAVFEHITERKRTEAALRESEERLRLAAEATGVGMFDVDLFTGKHIWSATAKRCLGLPADAEVDEAVVQERIYPDDRERVWQATEEARDPQRGGRFAMEYRTTGATGAVERWIAARGKVLFDSKGRAQRFLGVMSDITERIRAEAALRESEVRLRLAMECAGLGTTELDLSTGQRRWSEIAKRCFGLPPETEPDDRTFEKAIHPDDLDRMLQVVAKSNRPESGGEQAAEFRTIGIADGKTRWIAARAKVFFDSEGRPVRRVALVRDLTEQKLAEDKLRQSEERLRLAVESAGLGTIEMDPYTGRRIWSDVAKAQFGLAPDADIDETTFQKAVHPEDWHRVQQSLEEAMRPGSSGEHKAEFRTIGIQDGKERWLSAHGRVFFDSQGRVARRLGVMQDITERKRAEEAVQGSEERLRLAVECAGLGIIEFNAETGDRNWSDVAKELFGLPSDAQPDDTTLRRAIHPDDRERVYRLMEEAAEWKGRDHVLAWDYRTIGIGDGKGRWLSTQGKIFFDERGRAKRMMFVAQDVSERTQMEEALRRREQEISALLDDNPDMIVRLDRQFHYMYVNATMARMVGMRREDCIGKRAIDVGFPQDLVDRWRPGSRRVFETGQPTSTECSHAAFGGAAEWEERVIPEFAPDGSVESILVIGRDITERKRLERMVESNRDEVRALAASLLTIQEEERRRVARELHDQICQDLAALAIELGSMAAEPPEQSESAVRFRKLQARVVQAAEEARHISHQLHPPMLDDLGLVISLRSLCKDFTGQTGIEVEFSAAALPGAVPREVTSCVFRVAQQSLQNTAKHAGAGTVSVDLGWREERLTLRVADDGVGFDQEAVQGQGGLGLIGMKERARMIAGKLTIVTEPGHGTRIELEVPLPETSL